MPGADSVIRLYAMREWLHVMQGVGVVLSCGLLVSRQGARQAHGAHWMYGAMAFQLALHACQSRSKVANIIHWPRPSLSKSGLPSAIGLVTKVAASKHGITMQQVVQWTLRDLTWTW